MREFLLNSEELLDRNALAFLENGEIWGLLPCHCVRFNEKVKLAYFTEGYTCLGRQIPYMSLDEICFVEQKLLDRIRMLEGRMEISLENLVWDVDGIYLDGQERGILPLPSGSGAGEFSDQSDLSETGVRPAGGDGGAHSGRR